MKKSQVAFWVCCILLSAAACGGKPEDSVPSGPITVTGRVWKTPGVPETKALVLIPGNDRKPVVVDAQGAFTVPNVTAPYELLVRMEDKGGRAYVRIYRELTLKEPSVFNVGNTDIQTQSNTLMGKVTGKQTASGASQVSVDLALPMRRDLWTNSHVGGGVWAKDSGDFSFEPDWSLDAAEAGSLIALQYTLENERPQRYLAYARRDNVSFQKPAPAMDIALSPVTSANISVDVTASVTGFANNVDLNMEHAPSLVTKLEFQRKTAAAFSIPVPEVSGATFELWGWLTEYPRREESLSWVRAGLKAGESLKVVNPPGIKPILPAEGALDVAPTTTLSWTQVPNAVYTHLIKCGDYLVLIDQTAPQLSLPDLSALGMTLKGDVSCQWTLLAHSPVKSANEMIGLDRRKLQELARTDTLYMSTYGSYFRLAK